MLPRYKFFVGVCLVALSGCGDTYEFAREKYTGERYGDPVVGARRAPLLNPKTASAPKGAPEKIVPAAPQGNSPYDQYDAKGNEKGGTNYVKEWMGDKPKPKPITAPSERKSFRGLAPSAPVNIPAAVSVPEHVLVAPSEKIEPQAPKPQVKPVPRPEPEEENGVMVPIIEDRVENIPQSATFAELAPSAGGEKLDYPHLADVPKVPEAFAKVKADKAAVHQDLQNEYNGAMEEKQKLDAEPTELPDPTLPQVEGMIRDIDNAVNSDIPIISATNETVKEASPAAGN